MQRTTPPWKTILTGMSVWLVALLWLMACVSAAPGLRGVCASPGGGEEDNSGQKKVKKTDTPNHVRAVRSATGSPSTERPIVPISASNSMWAPLGAPCALHEAGQASHTWLP